MYMRVFYIFIFSILFNGCSDSDYKNIKSNELNVLIWDEQQSEQKEAYDKFIGEVIADHLDKNPKINTKSVSIDDSHYGLSDDLLDWSDIIIWWGHVRHDDIPDETVDKILTRLTNGELDFIALHSAHWAKPFMEAMNYKTISNIKDNNPEYFDNSDYSINYIEPFVDRSAPERKDVLTPRVELRKFPSGKINTNIYLPNSCFPAYRPDGKSSFIHSLKSDHPIMKGVPQKFEITSTEMYDEPFHVPEPDEVVFDERWETGEWFRSGAIWNIGKGKLFYFRPGHETYDVFTNQNVLKIIENSCLWMFNTTK